MGVSQRCCGCATTVYTPIPFYPAVGPIFMTPAVKIPPLQIFGETPFSYEQIKRSFYFWFFQMQEGAKEVVSASNFALIDGIWRTGLPATMQRRTYRT